MPAALAAIRSLGRARIRVAAVGTRRTDPGLLSRHARDRRILPDAAEDPDGFVRSLIPLLADLGRPTVLPVTDLTLTVLDRHRETLPPCAREALPERETLEAVLDRETTLRIARRLGIPFPRTRLVSSESDVVIASREIAFPAVVKPRRSRWFTPGGRVAGATATFAATAMDAATAIRRLDPGAGPVLLQEWHRGEGRGVFVLLRRGEPVARFAHRRLASLRPTGGASARCEAVAAEGETVDASVRLLRDVSWEGPAMVEWLRPEAGGPDLLMEVNGRLWGSLALAVRAGVDVPVLWARTLRGETVRGPERYVVGTQLRHVLGEALHAWRAWRGPPAGWPGPWPGRRDLLRGLLPAAAPRVAWQVVSVDDPVPFAGEVLGALLERGRRR